MYQYLLILFEKIKKIRMNPDPGFYSPGSLLAKKIRTQTDPGPQILEKSNGTTNLKAGAQSGSVQIQKMVEKTNILVAEHFSVVNARVP